MKLNRISILPLSAIIIITGIFANPVSADSSHVSDVADLTGLTKVTFPNRANNQALDTDETAPTSLTGWCVMNNDFKHRVISKKTGEIPMMSDYYLETDTLSSGAFRTRSSKFQKVAGEPSKINIRQLYGSDMEGMVATIGEGSLSIPGGAYCKVTNSSGESTMATVCPIDLVENKIYPNGTIEGVISVDGTVSLPSWGIFVVDGSQASAVAIVAKSVFRPANATMKGDAFGGGQTNIWGVVLSQPYANRIKVENFGNTGEAVDIDLLSTGVAEIAPQYMGTTTYGEVDCMPLSAKGTGDISRVIMGLPSGKGLLIDPWGLCVVTDPTMALLKMDKTLLTPLTDFAVSWPEALAVSFQGGGSESSPYLISSYNDLLALSQIVAEGKDQSGIYYRLTNDIDCSGQKRYFTPIGQTSLNTDYATTNDMPQGTSFNGTIDGNGFTIRGLVYNTGRRGYSGLVGWLGPKGKITHLNVDNSVFLTYGIGVGALAGVSYGEITGCSVNNTSILIASYHGGGIAGLSKGSIDNCKTNVAITAFGNAGGIAGSATGEVRNCRAGGTMRIGQPDNMLFIYFGGILGQLNGTFIQERHSALLENSVSSIIIDERPSTTCTGGLVGVALSNSSSVPPQIRGCVALNTISSNAADNTSGTTGRLGGLVGTLYNAKISDCLSAGVLLAPNNPKNFGGVVGYIMSAAANSIENVVSVCQPISSASTPDSRTALCGGLTQTTAEIFKNTVYDKQVSALDFSEFGFDGALDTRTLVNGQNPGLKSAERWIFKNGFYPVPKGLEELPEVQLAAAPAILPEGQNSRSVSSNFSLCTDSGVEWYILTENGLVSRGAGITVKGDVAEVGNEYARDILCALIPSTPFLKEIVVNTAPASIWGGAGTADDPYRIKSLTDLKNLAEGTDIHGNTYEGVYFKVCNDIDCRNDPSFQGIASTGVATNEFSGTFDGGGFTIDNIAMDKVGYKDDGVTAVSTGSKSYCGFIGRLNKSGVIRNLTLGSGCRMRFWGNSGSISGYVAGKIENCRSLATVEGMSSYIGGIAGQVQKTTGSVTGSLFAGHITGGLSGVGAIAGYSYGLIDDCQNDGVVKGDSINPFHSKGKANYIGGIVGYSSASTVKNCVNQGDVSGPKNVGGIAGYILGASTVEGCLNTGIISVETGTASRGAILGAASGTSYILASNVYDRQTTPVGSVALDTNPHCTGLTTSELCSGKCPQALSTVNINVSSGQYPVLDIFKDEASSQAMRSIVVTLGEGESIDDVSRPATLATYEGLVWNLTDDSPYYSISPGKLEVIVPQGNQPANDILSGAFDGWTRRIPIRTIPNVFKGSGTLEDPYLISDKNELALLASKVNNENIPYSEKHFLLNSDLDYTDDSSYIPIGYDQAVFGGHFHGGGHTISNLNLNYLESHTALFGNVSSAGSVSDLILKGGRFAPAEGKSKAVAGFVYSLAGTISKCTNYNEIDATSGTYGSGIVHELKGTATVSDCSNYGTVSAKSGTSGGIAGTMLAGSALEGCYNYGVLNMISTYVGGIVGKSAGRISNCSNHADITGSKNGLGGIVGYAQDTCYIDNCCNFGNMSLTGTAYYVGGIVGYGYGRAIISNSENRGDISVIGSASYGKAGGIAGQLAAGSAIENSANYGAIQAATGPMAGGIAGLCEGASNKPTGKFANVCNYGSVTGVKQVGGLFGRQNSNNEVNNCCNYGWVKSSGVGAQDTGGITGLAGGLYSRCVNNGVVSTTGYYCGGIVGNGTGVTLNDCVNTGDVSSTSMETQITKPLAAGIWAYGRGDLTRCANFGSISAPTNASGLIGYFTTKVNVTDSYNASAVTATNSDGTVAPIMLNMPSGENVFENLFYDNSLYTGPEQTGGIANGLPTKHMLGYNPGQGWNSAEACYPIPETLSGNESVNFHAAQVALTGTDTSFESVNCPIVIGLLDGVEWSVSDSFEVRDGKVVPTSQITPGTSGVITKRGVGGLVKEYKFKTGSTSGVEVADCEQDAEIAYFSLDGIRIAEPTADAIVIRVMLKPDGTSERGVIRFRP